MLFCHALALYSSPWYSLSCRHALNTVIVYNALKMWRKTWSGKLSVSQSLSVSLYQWCHYLIIPLDNVRINDQILISELGMENTNSGLSVRDNVIRFWQGYGSIYILSFFCRNWDTLGTLFELYFKTICRFCFNTTV